ncbi:type II toxin-antitoxin system PemK/MazF family toxin [Aurantimonas coralicida]|uniref:type II toxin-antitoxin system PemK/MazF family toxin n=1 Tax=Aurantimonas coralicida TaxID=182270 RepID=UPI0039B6FDA9|nr:type II toxin-antitoxin system PemK/MazF family toxin [Aurantimonas coralicida]
MPLQFPPSRGTLVICDYSTGFRPPEMVKRRLAVVISHRLPQRDGLCAVVPLSTTPARAGIRYQCRIDLPQSPPPPFEGTVKWVKADMLATVCFNRLDLPRTGRDRDTGRRRYLQIRLPDDEMLKVQEAVLHGLCMGHLTAHL